MKTVRTLAPGRPVHALRPLVLGALALSVPGGLLAQTPGFGEVVGHEFGDRITEHHEMVRYLERLAATSSRVEVREQGQSWEGRALLVAIVTAPENHARLGQIQANAQRLGDPRSTPAEEAASIIANQPVILWFGGSIHGFELSGSEGALRLLEHLTTSDDPETMDVLRNTVVLIDPMLNPDGRDAFAHRNHENLGRVPNATPEDWANDFTRWEALKYRTGHYYFDTNRDWFAQTQRETRARVETILAWHPQAVTDMHEMGTGREFFFYPGAPPTSPYIPPFALRWIEQFANAYAASFDAAGFEYMTRESYDYFYPGYTDSYGSFQGAAGMLYEQGSSRGLALQRPDESVRTLAEATEHQYTAAWTAARYAAANRAQLLQEYYEALARAVADGNTGIRRYLIPPGGDEGLRTELVRTLRRGGVDVERLLASASVSSARDRWGAEAAGRDFPAGTYVVNASQPRMHLIRTLLEPRTPVEEAFLEEARARVDRGEDAEFYDITSWSLPLVFNVTAFSTGDARSLVTESVSDPVRPDGAGVDREATYAYLLDGRQAASVAALYHLTDRGYRAAVALKPSRIQGEDVPGGSVVVHVGHNDQSLHATVRELADRYGIEVRSVSTGMADRGFPSLGSADVVHVRRPEIAILAEEPVQGYSFGWAWYTLDQAYDIRTTVVRVRSVAETPLDRFDVVVLPAAESEALADELGTAGLDRLRRWVHEGGTLVTLGTATSFALDSSGAGLVALRSWYDTDAGEDAQEFEVPGAVLRGVLDREYWLAAGYGEPELPVLVEGRRVFVAPDGPPSARRRVVGRFAARDQLAISGHAWEESLDRLSEAVFLYEERVDSGRVICFAEDPNFRGFWRGANRLFLNAVVVGPSAP